MPTDVWSWLLCLWAVGAVATISQAPERGRKLARDKLTGDQPIQLGELFMLPKRIRLELFAQAMLAELPTAV